MFIISIIKRSLFEKMIIPFYTLFFLLLILVPIVGLEVKGAQRWLDLYIFRLQPIELLKPFFVLTTAKILTIKNLQNLQIKYLLSFILLSSIIILLIDQPDLGQSILLIGTWMSMIFISGVSIKYIIGFFLTFFITVSSLLYLMPEKFGYIINRILTFLDPEKGDFQSSKALDAIKLGGLKGRGMGEGILKDRVPEAHTDYIIAVIAEEYGSIISILIVITFLYILLLELLKIRLNRKKNF